MLLVTSGQFMMGSDAPEAAPHEQPVVSTTLSCFFLARFPVTNAQFELFDPAHSSQAARLGPATIIPWST